MIYNCFSIFNRNSDEYNIPIITPLSQKELLNSFKHEVKSSVINGKSLVYFDMPEDFYILRVAYFDSVNASFHSVDDEPVEFIDIFKDLNIGALYENK